MLMWLYVVLNMYFSYKGPSRNYTGFLEVNFLWILVRGVDFVVDVNCHVNFDVNFEVNFAVNFAVNF